MTPENAPSVRLTIGDHTDFTKISKKEIVMRQPELLLGGFGPGPHQLMSANTVAVDQMGNLYVVDDRQGVIKVWSLYTMTGEVSQVIDSGILKANGLKGLGEIRAIATGGPEIPTHETLLYVLDCKEGRDPECRILVRPHFHSDQWTQLAHTDFAERPHGLVVDRDGRIIVCERKGVIEVLKPDGKKRDKHFGDDGLLRLKKVKGETVKVLKAIAVDEDGAIYVADKGNGRVLKIDSKGKKVKAVFGKQGDGKRQFSGDVEGIALGRKGNLYARDESGDRFLVFDKDGDCAAAFGERGMGYGQQENADEFCIDTERRKLIIADADNYRICVHRMGPGPFLIRDFVEQQEHEGLVVQPAWVVGGEKGAAPGTQFNEPNELGFDHNGNLWCGDVYNLRIQIFDQDGNFLRTVGGPGEGEGQFVQPPPEVKKYGPEAIRLGNDGLMYAVDRGGRRVNVYDPETFAPVRTITSDKLQDPTGLDIDAAGNLYIADQAANRVHQFTTEGEFLRTIQPEFDGQSILLKTETLGIDEGRDRLFASSEDESRIEVFQLSTGEYLDLRVGERQQGAIPQPGRYVDDVEGLAVDPLNHWLLSSDEDNGRILISDLSSVDLFDQGKDFAFLGAFGRLGHLPGEFKSADGITVNPDLGLVAVADQGNYRIQVFRIADIKAELGLS